MDPQPDTDRNSKRLDIIALLWIVLSIAWAVVIIVTDHVSWPLALWVATTVGPLTALRARADKQVPGTV